MGTTPGRRCEKCTGQAFLSVDEDGDAIYSCIQCSFWCFACPLQGCPGVLRLPDLGCTNCVYNHDAERLGAGEITPENWRVG